MKGYFRAVAPYFVGAGVFSLFINTLQLTFSLYMLAVYDGVLTSFSLPTLRVVTLLALSALLVWGGLEFCRSRLLIRAGVLLDRLLCQTVLKKMLQDLSRLDSLCYRDGLKDINTLRNYFGGSSIFAFFDVPWIFIYLTLIYLIHPLLGLTATVGALGVLLIGFLQGKMSQHDLQRAEVFNAHGKQWLSTSLRAANEMQSMGMIGAAGRGFARVNEQELQFQDRAGSKNHALGAISQSFGIWMQVVIFGVGAFLVLQGGVSAGVIIAASIIMGQALSPIKLGISAWKQTADAKIAYDNLNRLLHRDHLKRDLEAKEIDGALTVDGVSLAIGQVRVLKDIHFHLKPGEIMGLIGPNGSGKTSLCRLVLGIWAPSAGKVTLDGLEMCQIDKEKSGESIGYLPQNVELFAGSVKRNIARMGVVVSDLVVDAAVRAGAHETILRFAQGYETEIGEGGVGLSGGQRQRVGLARALYGNPKLVVLDEPNSNLDQDGENALIEALNQLRSNRVTTIMITHKPSLLATVDKILLLRNGEQIQFGDRDSFLG